MAEGGWRGFYHGFGPAMARAVPANVSPIRVEEIMLLITWTGRDVPRCRVVDQVDELALLEGEYQNLTPGVSGGDAGQSVVYPGLHYIHIMSVSLFAFALTPDSSLLHW